jgi:hypothetical protein
LYWAHDTAHADDWFVVAVEEDDAVLWVIAEEGATPGTVEAEIVAALPVGIKEPTTTGGIPGWASVETIEACGGRFVSESPAVVELGGREFREGSFDAWVEVVRRLDRGD